MIKIAELGKFFVTVGSKFDSKGFDKARKAINKVALAGIAMGGALIVAGYKAAQAAGIQERAELTLAQAMKQAGTFTEEAFEHNKKYASSLQKMTEYGDEAILGVQKMLTNFGIEGEMLDKLTLATLDLAAAKKMDLTAAADLVAKSVGSTTNALTRYGIVVEGAEGSTARCEMAVKNISKIFGGAAKANAETFLGAMRQLGNTIGDDVWEAIGFKLLPILKEYIKIIKTNVIPKIKEWIKESGNIESIIIKANTALGLAVKGAFSFVIGIKLIIESLKIAKEKIAFFESGIKLVTSALLFNVPAAISFGKEMVSQSENAKEGMDDLAESIIIAGEQIKNIEKYFEKFGNIAVDAAKKAAKGIAKTGKGTTSDTKKEIKKRTAMSADYYTWQKDNAEKHAEEERERKAIAFEEFVLDLQTKMENTVAFIAQGVEVFSSYYDLKAQSIKNDLTADLDAETERYDSRKAWIEANIEDEEKRNIMLDELEEGHSATLNNLRDESERKEKKLRQKMKKFNIAEAVANTALGATKAFAQGGWLLGSFMAAMVIAAGALQIATIKAQKFAKGALAMVATPAIFGEAGPELALPLNHPNTTKLLSEAMSKAGGRTTIINNITVPPITSRRVADGYGKIIGDAIFKKIKKTRRI